MPKFFKMLPLFYEDIWAESTENQDSFYQDKGPLFNSVWWKYLWSVDILFFHPMSPNTDLVRAKQIFLEFCIVEAKTLPSVLHHLKKQALNPALFNQYEYVENYSLSGGKLDPRYLLAENFLPFCTSVLMSCVLFLFMIIFLVKFGISRE